MSLSHDYHDREDAIILNRCYIHASIKPSNFRGVERDVDLEAW